MTADTVGLCTFLNQPEPCQLHLESSANDFFFKKVHFDLIKLDKFQLLIHVLHSSFQRLMHEALKFDPKVVQQKQGRKVMYKLQCFSLNNLW